MLVFKFKKPMLSSDLPVNLELTNCCRKSKHEKSEYIKKYQSTIGLRGRWFVSEKLKGPRAVWTGRELLNKHLIKYSDVPTWFMKKLPANMPLDGVLEGFHDSEPFNWRKVRFVIFDVPIPNASFEMRINRLKNNKLMKDQMFKPHEFTLIKDIQNGFYIINEMYNEIVKRGGKGVMLINADSHYQGKKVNTLFTYRKLHSGRAEIVSFHEGQGKYYGFLGKFKCKTPEGKIFYCSDDIPDDIRKCYHFDRTVCTFITNKDSVPKVGDTLLYTSTKVLKDNRPRQAIYSGFER